MVRGELAEPDVVRLDEAPVEPPPTTMTVPGAA